MSWHYLPEGEAESWGVSSLGGPQLTLVSLISQPEMGSSPACETAPSPGSASGMTSKPSPVTKSPAKSMSSAQAGPVRTSQQPGPAPASPGPSQDSGGTSPGYLGRFDLSAPSSRTPLFSPHADSKWSSETWPRWGSMRNGACSELEPVAWTTKEIASGSLLPTPTANDAKNCAGPGQFKRNSLPLNALAGGPLCPTFVEEVMGWPAGWTALEPLGTGRFLEWLRLHGR